MRKTTDTYVPVKPCRRGHLLRYSSNGQCYLCDQERYTRHPTASTIARRTAKSVGKEFYNSGELCANGHSADRQTSTGQCVQCKEYIPHPSANTLARRAAKKADKKSYNSGELCWRGHNADRQTSTGRCVICMKVCNSNRYVPTPTASTMTRRVAKAAGEEFYNSGEPCANGHTSDRRTRTGQCVRCVKSRSKLRFVLRDVHRGLMLGRIRRKGTSAIMNALPYTPEEYIAHLDSTLPAGLSCLSEDSHKWHVDHILPISFIRKALMHKGEDKAILVAQDLNNLRMLPAKENLEKHAKTGSAEQADLIVLLGERHGCLQELMEAYIPF